MNELSKRIIVATFGIPFAILLIYIGRIPFFLFILILSNLVLREFYNITRQRNYSPYATYGYTVNSLILTLLYIFLTKANNLSTPIIFFSIVLLIYSSPFVLLLGQIWSERQIITENFAITISGLIWINFAFASLILVRNLPLFLNRILELVPFRNTFLTGLPNQIDSNWIFLFFISILGSIWICDSLAYFIGSALGKHKLAPSVSPKKSWEGAIAGLLGAFISISLFNYLFSLSFTTSYTFIFSIVVGVIGQIGDLAESKIKRDFNVKDSSNFLPGHGGLLDRFDSIMFVYPTILIVFLIIIFFTK